MAENLENKKIAVKVSGVKKKYKLGQIGGGTLQADLQSWWARVRGKEDPNSKIGSDQRSNGKTFMALNGVDLTIYKGEAVGIIGSNGAGKSTLLKLLSRVTAPTEGSIDIYGRIASMLEVGTGFNPEMTGRENVYLNGAILGMTKAEIDAKMEEIIEFSEVREFIDTPVKRYSSGMFVKLAFSVAAHLDAEIMIMDEVLAVGDVNFQQKCLKKMRDVALEEGRTVLYVSHNMSTIKTLCNRCIVLNKGKIAFIGDVDTAINIYANSNEFKLTETIDLSKRKRMEGITKLFEMQKIVIKETELSLHQPLIFTLKYVAKQDLDNLILRFVVFDRNGLVIGTSYSKYFSSYQGENTIAFKFDTSYLVNGEYIADIIFCSYDGKVQLRHDIVTKALSFKINETELYFNMNWMKNGWGNIKFNDIQVLEDEL